MKQALALEKNPALRGVIYLAMGGAYWRMSRSTDAIEMVNKVLELKQFIPDDDNGKALLFNCYSFLSMMYDISSQCEKAIDAFDKALQLRSNNASLYANVASCLVKSGNVQDAEKAMRYAIQLDPNNAVPKCNLGLVLVREKKYSEAEAELRNCVKLGTDNWGVYWTLGGLLLQRKELREAAQMFRQALRLHPGDSMIMNGLGYALVELNENLKEAVDLTEGAVKLNPSNPAFRDSLGWAYFKSGRLQDAERELFRATQENPKSPVIFEHLGDCYKKIGKATDAVSSWKKSLLLTNDEEMKNRLQSKIDSK